MFEIGNGLREARQRQQLAFADIEAATKIRAGHLDALEREEFDRLPPGLYRRSFLREYAVFLGLDGDAFVQEYALRYDEPELETIERGSRASLPPRRTRRESRILLPIGGVVLAIIAGIGIWRVDTGGGGQAPSPLPPTPRRVAPSAAPPVVRRHATPSVARQRPPAALTLTASRGSCWLQVQIGSATGKTVYEQTLQLGQVVRFGLRRPLFIRLGAPWNLDASIGGRSVTAELPTRTGDVRAAAGGITPAP